MIWTNRKIESILIWFYLALIVFNLAFWGIAIYVALHFILKWW